MWLLKLQTFNRQLFPPGTRYYYAQRTAESGSPARRSSLLVGDKDRNHGSEGKGQRSLYVHIHPLRGSETGRLSSRFPVADTGFVHGICVLEESLMLVTSPPEKNTTIRGSAKHCGNVPSGSSSSVQNINKEERSAWRSSSA